MFLLLKKWPHQYTKRSIYSVIIYSFYDIYITVVLFEGFSSCYIFLSSYRSTLSLQYTCYKGIQTICIYCPSQTIIILIWEFFSRILDILIAFNTGQQTKQLWDLQCLVIAYHVSISPKLTGKEFQRWIYTWKNFQRKERASLFHWKIIKQEKYTMTLCIIMRKRYDSAIYYTTWITILLP